MASPRANKRAKVLSSAKEPVTTLDNKAFDEKHVVESKTHTKMTFRCPVTIDNVFTAPTATQVKVFYESRSSKRGNLFDHLPEGEKLAWTESFHDNKTLMGFIVYTQLFPKLLQNRIKLNAATYHWAHLDNSSEKGRTKLEQRRNAVVRWLLNYIYGVRVLLRYDANVLASTDDGYTALHISVHNGHLAVTKALVKAGADLEEAACFTLGPEKIEGNTPLHLAAGEGFCEIVAALVGAGANVDCRLKNAATPLYLSACCGQLEAVRILIHRKLIPYCLWS